MRPLREDERDEIEAVKHLIKHVNTKPNVEGFRVWEAMLELERIGNKYVMNGIVTEEELSELIDLDDMKELLSKLMGKVKNYIATGETK